LKIEKAKAFWDKPDSWEYYVELARKGQKPGSKGTGATIVEHI
jgi:hypothetical protein